MGNLYLTADRVGEQSGGGKVTWHESLALFDLEGDFTLVSREQIETALLDQDEPWCWDRTVEAAFVEALAECRLEKIRNAIIKLCHVYAGTFSRTIHYLKSVGCKVTYTAAAHDVEASRKAHTDLGIPYDYPHLTDPELWKRYLAGYLAADVVVCPSQHSAHVMRGFGRTGRIEIIPHGIDIPDSYFPLPSRFVCGYLGAVGPDKGLRYLLAAWKQLNYRDATLVIAGKQSTSSWVRQLVQVYGGGNIELRGWVKDVSDFYNSISVYCQPSVTEGFGIEVLEAMAHGRPVVCSLGAGAADVVSDSSAGLIVGSSNSADIAAAIDNYKSLPGLVASSGEQGRKTAENYTWDKIRQRYIDLWRSLL